MGIPKFYRWLSERYPLLNQRCTATETPPDFDNLYLDMNGIIHNCTHANQREVKLTEHDMMLKIFDYIDKLVQIIRPQKLLFMAIDGVAPRAKMNQQRSRRFKAAKERIELQAEKERKGEPIPTDPFDSNCITPGTPFMERLGKHLRFFIRRKMAEDPTWQKPTVIFSGHDVPGEGEHKIMEYLRWEKKSPNYQPNQRHCMYGLDADLVMLSLVTHEPHFCLLREIVSYTGGNRGQPAREVLENPCQENFILFHIGLLREYLELEFMGVPVPFEPSGKVDVERVVDDFVLFCMLIGNDFLPALPTLDINEGALNAIMTLYKQLLAEMGGYLTYAGDLDRRRLEMLLAKLGAMEQDVLEERAKDAEYMENKRSKRGGGGGPAYSIPQRRAESSPALAEAAAAANPAILGTSPANGPRIAAGPSGAGFGGRQARKVASAGAFASLASAGGTDTETDAAESDVPVGDTDDGDTSDGSVALARKVAKSGGKDAPLAAFFDVINHAGGGALAGIVEEALEEESGLEDAAAAAAKEAAAEPTMMSKEARQLILAGGEAGLEMWKARWYGEKLCAKTAQERRKVVEHYLQGLHWVLEYYYRGVASWDWYYPYYYAPCASDMVSLADVPVRFSQGKPFRPYEQLLSVLPSASAPLLPPAYQPLMLEPTSPILDFYPTTFDIDGEGKRASWEGIVKVPFVDESRLLAAVASIPASKLTQDEQARNVMGDILLFSYCTDSTDTEFCSSTMPQVFNDLKRCQSRVVKRKMPPPLPLGERGFLPAVTPGTHTGLESPFGFPSLRSIAVTINLRNAGVNVLGTPSRKESVILQLPDMSSSNFCAKDVAPLLLGKRCFVNWPYLQEAFIMRVSDDQEQWYVTGHDQHQCKKWQSQEATKWGKDNHVIAAALLTKHGLDVGSVKLVVHVKLCKGYLRHLDGTIQKLYMEDEATFPLQAVLRKRPAPPPVPGAPPPLDLDVPTPVTIKEGDRVIFLGRGHYGCVATVLPDLGQGMSKSGKALPGADVSSSKMYRIAVQPIGPGGTDPVARPARMAVTSNMVRYFPSHDVGRRLRLNPRVLGRITSNVWISDGDERYDVGLAVRAPSKDMCVPGFACPAPDPSGGTRVSWQYSSTMTEILGSYREAHPWVYQVLEQQANAPEGSGSSLRLSDLLPDTPASERKAMLAAAVKWVKSSPLAGKPLVKSSTVLLPDQGVRQLQMAMPAMTPQPAVEYENVPAALLLPPFTPGPNQIKFSIQGGTFELGERVVCLLRAGFPPFGIHGTVIGIFEDALEVVFDKEFAGGTDLGGKLTSRCGGFVPKDIMLNTSKPMQMPINRSQIPRMVIGEGALSAEATINALLDDTSARPAAGPAARAAQHAAGHDNAILKLLHGQASRTVSTPHAPPPPAALSDDTKAVATATRTVSDTSGAAAAKGPPPPMLSPAMMAFAAGKDAANPSTFGSPSTRHHDDGGRGGGGRGESGRGMGRGAHGRGVAGFAHHVLGSSGQSPSADVEPPKMAGQALLSKLLSGNARRPEGMSTVSTVAPTPAPVPPPASAGQALLGQLKAGTQAQVQQPPANGRDLLNKLMSGKAPAAQQAASPTAQQPKSGRELLSQLMGGRAPGNAGGGGGDDGGFFDKTHEDGSSLTAALPAHELDYTNNSNSHYSNDRDSHGNPHRGGRGQRGRGRGVYHHDADADHQHAGGRKHNQHDDRTFEALQQESKPGKGQRSKVDKHLQFHEQAIKAMAAAQQGESSSPVIQAPIHSHKPQSHGRDNNNNNGHNKKHGGGGGRNGGGDERPNRRREEKLPEFFTEPVQARGPQAPPPAIAVPPPPMMMSSAMAQAAMNKQ